MDFLGWQVLATTISLGALALKDIYTKHSWDDIRLIALALTSLLSIVMMAVPLVMFRLKQTSLPGLLATASCAMAICAAAPFLLVKMTILPLAGFYLWLAGGAMVCCAIANANANRRTAHADLRDAK